MPVDLLDFLEPPAAYSGRWLWLGVVLLVAVIAWYAAVLVWTMPPERLRGIPMLGDAHRGLLRRRFAAGIARIRDRRRRGELADEAAFGEMSHIVRSFLHQMTGVRAQYLHLDEIAAGELAPATGLLTDLRDARFDTAARPDAERLGERAEELIRSWT